MSKENLDWQSFDSGDIPSADDAWKDMRRRLDDEMPGGGIVKPFYSRPVSTFKLFATGAVAVLLLLVITLFLSKQTGFLPNKEISGKISSGSSRSAEENNGAESAKKENKRIGEGGQQKTVNTNEPTGENNDEKGDTDSNAINTQPEEVNAEKNQLFLKTKNGAAALTEKKNIKRNTGKLVEYTRKKKGINSSKKNLDSNEDNKSSETGIASSVITDNSIKKDVTDTSSLLIKKDNVVAKKEAKNLTDSLPSIPEPGPGESDNIIVRAGVQWNLQVPSPGSANYFGGPTGKTEPYRVLIPGIWANVQFETTILSLEINPYYSQHIPGKSFATSNKTNTRGDTIIVTTESMTVNRVFGTGINLGYANNVYRNWWAGGGIEGNWWRNAVITSDITEEKNISGSPAIVESNSFKNSRAIAASEWEDLSKFQVKINGEIFYRKKQLAAGLRIGFPVMPFSDSKGPQHPLDLRFIVQLPLLRHSVER